MGGNKMIDKKKVRLIIGLFVGIAVIISVIAIITNVTKESNQAAKPVEDDSLQSAYVDPYSGETVYNQASREPEAYQNENPVVYLGFTNLLDYGLLSNQQQRIQQYIADFSEHDELKIKEVTIDKQSITQKINSDTGDKTLSFVIITNRDEKLKYTLINSYSSISSMSTKIYSYSTNSQGELLFDSATDSGHTHNNL